MFDTIKKWFGYSESQEPVEQLPSEYSQVVEKLKSLDSDFLNYISTVIDWSQNNLELFRSLIKDKNYVVLTSDGIDKEEIKYFMSDARNVKFLSNAKDIIRESVIETMGPVYEQRLDEFEPDTAMAFKEADYQIARAEAIEAELQYYKAVNDPNGLHSTQLYNLWNHVQDKKKALDVFEQELSEHEQQAQDK